MSDESLSPATSVSPRLLRDLHAFLSLDAPFLLGEMPDGGDLDTLEQDLLTRIAALYAPRSGLAEEVHYPGTTHQDTVLWSRDDLETLVEGFFERQRIKESLSDDERLEMYRAMLLTRALDDALKRAFEAKEIRWDGFPSPQKGFRSTGQEAIVGAALRLRRPPAHARGTEYDGDIICPLIRDLGALLMFRPDPLPILLVQYGKAGTPMDGRDLHHGDLLDGILPPTAPLAIGTQTLIGLAYAFKLRREDRVCVSFIGEGGSSLGEWHEAINFAAVQRLNMVFVVENNQWALGTHVSEQSRARRFANKAAGYGIPGVTVFGNDPDEVAAAVSWAADRARTGAGPALVELVSYRRPGHAHHDDDRFHGSPENRIPGYELDDEREAWLAVDPIELYRERVIELGIADAERCEVLAEAARVAVATAVETAGEAPWPEPADYRERVYAPRRLPMPKPSEGESRRMSYDEAVREGIAVMMEEDRGVFVLGEDVGGRYGGAFGVTRGLTKRFGAERCLNTPLAESAIVGCGTGAALAGMRPVVEMQFADFLAPAFNALVNNAPKLHWRWGGTVPMVVRLPYGGATGTTELLLGGGPFHSQCPEMWFLRVPGWKVVAPATPSDAKGLMIAAIRDENPVVYLEAKGLYGFFRSDLREEVPLGSDHEVPIGEALVRREGSDLTLFTYGAMVWTALAAAEELAAEGIEMEVVDLRSLLPLDEKTIRASVEKTNRVLILHEDSRTGGFAGELAARLCESSFYELDAPIRRVTAPDTPPPYSPPLEYDFLPKAEDVVRAARALARE